MGSSDATTFYWYGYIIATGGLEVLTAKVSPDEVTISQFNDEFKDLLLAQIESAIKRSPGLKDQHSFLKKHKQTIDSYFSKE